MEKETRLQAGLRRSQPQCPLPASIFPHLSLWPSPSISQSCGLCRMPCLFAKKAQVVLKEGVRPQAWDGQDSKEGELWQKRGAFSSTKS